MVDSHDTSLAGFGGEVGRLGESSVLVRETYVAKTWMLLRVLHRVGGGTADSHAEPLSKFSMLLQVMRSRLGAYLREGCDLLIAIRVEVLLSVVDGHTPVDAVGESRVLHDGHTLV